MNTNEAAQAACKRLTEGVMQFTRALPADLSHEQQQALSAVIEAHGSLVLAAARLSMTRTQLCSRVHAAGQRMGIKNQFDILLAWDRFAFGRATEAEVQ